MNSYLKPFRLSYVRLICTLLVTKKINNENKPQQKGSLGVQEGLEFDAADYREVLPVLEMQLHKVIDGPANKLLPLVLATRS